MTPTAIDWWSWRPDDQSRDLGLGAPRVLSVAEGRPAHGHLVIAVDGTPLLRAIDEGMPTGTAVLEALTLLTGTSPSNWEFPQVGWADLWKHLADSARHRRALLPSDRADALVAAAEHAAAVRA